MGISDIKFIVNLCDINWLTKENSTFFYQKMRIYLAMEFKDSLVIVLYSAEDLSFNEGEMKLRNYFTIKEEHI